MTKTDEKARTSLEESGARGAEPDIRSSDVLEAENQDLRKRLTETRFLLALVLVDCGIMAGLFFLPDERNE